MVRIYGYNVNSTAGSLMGYNVWDAIAVDDRYEIVCQRSTCALPSLPVSPLPQFHLFHPQMSVSMLLFSSPKRNGTGLWWILHVYTPHRMQFITCRTIPATSVHAIISQPYNPVIYSTNDLRNTLYCMVKYGHIAHVDGFPFVDSGLSRSRVCPINIMLLFFVLDIW